MLNYVCLRQLEITFALATRMAGRVTRRKIKRKFTRYTYKKALPYLLEDFDDRCAYSWMHRSEIDEMEVDHFNPHLKSKDVQLYSNLMPSLGSCNRTKGSTWPSPADRKLGLYLIDPTKELDYGHQIFEDPATHRLEGTTPAAKYHIRVLGLNSAYLINRRKTRSELASLLQRLPPQANHSWIDPATGVRHDGANALREVVGKMIPYIPPPPFP